MRASRIKATAADVWAARMAGVARKGIAQQLGCSLSFVSRALRDGGLAVVDPDAVEVRNPTPEQRSLWCRQHLVDLWREHRAQQQEG